MSIADWPDLPRSPRTLRGDFLGGLPLPGLPQPELLFLPSCLPDDLADQWMQWLLQSVPWETRTIRFGGLPVAVPRLVAWYGEEAYRYGGFTHPVCPLPPALAALRDHVQQQVVQHLPHSPGFNSVLLNQYRSGADSMSFHADNEVQLGPAPVIASLSLGAARTFRLRQSAAPAGGRRLHLHGRLTHGSLLVMHGRCQQDWQHAIPKEPCTGVRINLTFRLTAPLQPGPLRRRPS